MTWLFNNSDLIGQLVIAHLLIAISPIILSFAISVPIAWAANRFSWSRGTLLAVLGLLYAIPSLPLFIILPLIIGTGLRDSINLVVALTLYGIALMVRTTADGLASVDPDVRQSASAVGFSARSQFFRVELPLAGPVLLAGIRVVAVSTISLTTVGAVIGIDSLGSLFTDGFQRGITAEILTGIVLTIALALGVDGLLVLLGRVLMPWVAVNSGRVSRRERRRVQQAVTA